VATDAAEYETVKVLLDLPYVVDQLRVNDDLLSEPDFKNFSVTLSMWSSGPFEARVYLLEAEPGAALTETDGGSQMTIDREIIANAVDQDFEERLLARLIPSCKGADTWTVNKRLNLTKAVRKLIESATAHDNGWTGVSELWLVGVFNVAASQTISYRMFTDMDYLSNAKSGAFDIV
jgi:hypothetical protein